MVDWEESDIELQSFGSLRARSMMILRHAENFSQEEQLELQLSNGSVKMPWLVMAVLSPVFKDYLSYIEKSTILEPLIVIPDLSVEDFLVFKEHIFNSDEMTNEDVVKSVFDHLGCIYEKSSQILRSDTSISILPEVAQVIEETELETKPKKIPAIISHSSYGRPRRSTKRLLNDNSDEDVTAVDDPLDQDDNSTTSLCCPYCTKTYAHIKARNKHMISDHMEQCKEDNSFFPCEMCSALFVSNLGREKHIKRMHPIRIKVDTNAFDCPFCDLTCGFEK